MTAVIKILAVMLVVGAASACASNSRREQLQQQFVFENIDKNADGAISRAEFDSWKTTLQSLRRH